MIVATISLERETTLPAPSFGTHYPAGRPLGTIVRSRRSLSHHEEQPSHMRQLVNSIGRFVPTQLVTFLIIGTLGTGINLAVLALLHRALDLNFFVSDSVSTGSGIVFNYTLNNAVTFRDRRRRGVRWLTGLILFAATCSVGIVLNIGFASYLFSRHANWLASALAGVLLGVGWNYTTSRFYTWRWVR